ncbi:MAG: (Fe-S)-binding protein, partial [Firmicutes bacterium]|nr:(Fe-S)-binding protein [Bacillota bacterium]
MYGIEEYVGAVRHCLQCNFCLPACPIYREELAEGHSPRGRLSLIEAVFVDRTVAPGEGVRRRLDRCLLCAACARVCPGGIPLDDVFLAARAELGRRPGTGLTERFVVRQVVNRRVTSSLLGRSLSLARRLGLAPSDIPPVASPTFTRQAPRAVDPGGRAAARVAYFVGCGTEYLFPDTGEAPQRLQPGIVPRKEAGRLLPEHVPAGGAVRDHGVHLEG